MGDAGGTGGEEEVLESAFGDLGRTPRGGIQQAAGGGIAFDPALDAAEDVIQENGVGTGLFQNILMLQEF
jgi:hypothetical protein